MVPQPLLSPVSSRFLFVFARKRGPDCLGAWNRAKQEPYYGFWGKTFHKMKTKVSIYYKCKTFVFSDKAISFEIQTLVA